MFPIHETIAGVPEPESSPLRPEPCPAGDRLRRWRPSKPRHDLDEEGRPTNLSERDLARIQDTLEDAYVEQAQVYSIYYTVL